MSRIIRRILGEIGTKVLILPPTVGGGGDPTSRRISVQGQRVPQSWRRRRFGPKDVRLCSLKSVGTFVLRVAQQNSELQ